MAKFLAYKRNTREVVTVDTVNPAFAALGSSIALADTTNAFPNRCENIVAVFRGDPYFLYRSAANEVRLASYTSGAWADVAGFTPITGVGGAITPTCLHVVKDRLVAICELSIAAGRGAIARRSALDDGTTWDPIISVPFDPAITDSRAGPSIVWHNAVFFTTSDGIGHYDPSTNFLSTDFDRGDDVLLFDEKANFGAFTFFENDLYYVLPTDLPAGAPSFYKLDRSWSVNTPFVSRPTFTNQNLVIPGVGEIVNNNDAGNYSLFVNRNNVMSLIYSGSLGSKLLTITPLGTSFDVTDVTTSLLPTQFSGEPNLGFSYYVDDRRRNNEQHTIVIRFRPSIPIATVIASWDGINPVEQVASLDDGGVGLDLMVPEIERGDFRTFTDKQPAVFIDGVTQPFPGRVRIDYTIQDSGSRPIDVIPEYSVDGQTWAEMSQGDGDSGKTNLVSSIAGLSYFFNWDAFVDLDGDFDNVDVRVIARIAGV